MPILAGGEAFICFGSGFGVHVTVELSALVTLQLALVGGSDVAAIDAGLADPLGHGAVGYT